MKNRLRWLAGCDRRSTPVPTCLAMSSVQSRSSSSTLLALRADCSSCAASRSCGSLASYRAWLGASSRRICGAATWTGGAPVSAPQLLLAGTTSAAAGLERAPIVRDHAARRTSLRSAPACAASNISRRRCCRLQWT